MYEKELKRVAREVINELILVELLARLPIQKDVWKAVERITATIPDNEAETPGLGLAIREHLRYLRHLSEP